MTIDHKSVNIHENSDGLSRWVLPNTLDNPAYVSTNAETQFPIELINITDVETGFFEKPRESYKQYRNCHILNCLLDNYWKYSALANSLDYIRKISSDNGRCHLFNGILYHRSKHTFSMVVSSKMFIRTILLDLHDKIYSGHLSEDRKMEIIKTWSLWLSWTKDVIEYCHSCEKCQKVNEATGKRFGVMVYIQEPSAPCEVAHIDWVTALPSGRENGYNACLAIVDRYRKTPIFSPFHKEDTDIDTSLLIWDIVSSHTGPFKKIISDRDPKFS
ncbi:hypothetical protein O181_037010 [Austropuccinia psidii MF-1]|uniref:Integrase zinc-binding domain-containing protein n=1 Tax=Austropuccinia psidii MF-1 TaxID=1389203 RepID=A0A9Q3D7G7_9BASI|nr:hypothetical protein [Austropuccinia psidii MF-1]